MALAQSTFDAYFPHGIGAQTPAGVLSKLAIAGAALGRPDAIRYLVPNQMRAIQPERSTAYLGGGVLRNRMTLREGPQALDVQRLGRAAEALQIAMLQSTPPVPAGDAVIRLFTAWPRDWKAAFRLLARGGFLVNASYADGMVETAEIHSQVGGECRVLNPWTGSRIRLVRSGQRSETLEGDVVAFPTASGERISLEKLT
jgi:hypothetical protein